MELIDLLVRIFLYFFMTVGIVQTGPVRPSEPPPLPDDAVFLSYTTILDVQAVMLESFPVQVHLQVRGEHPDGCDLPVIVEQERDGNTITVRVYREVPAAVMCPMILRPYEDTIVLEGGFEPGTYTLHVNDFMLEITV